MTLFRYLILFLVINLSAYRVDSQIIPIDTSFNPTKFYTIIGVESALYAGSMTGLWYAWYDDYSSGQFHFFNDNAEWLQMDKLGHAQTSYFFGKIGYDFMRGAGINKSKSLIYGGGIGFFYLSTVEVLDGFSKGWGFSWGDMAANALGTALFVSQQSFFDRQILSVKYSYYPSQYSVYRPNVLGNNHLQRLIKDYNGQTYWLSANISAFLPKESSFPKWLNVAFGYGADGLLGGFSNPVSTDIPLFDRNRNFYLSLDLDLTQIPVDNVWLKSLLHVFSFIKIPFPSLEFGSDGVKFHPIYF